MSDLHRRLAQTRKLARRERRKRIIREFEDMPDEEIAQALADHSREAARRAKKRQADLRGPAREQRLKDILTRAMLDIADSSRDPKDAWWGGKLRHRKLCEALAKSLPADAKSLIRKGPVRPKLIAKYTAGLKGLRYDDYVARRRAGAGGLVADSC